MLFFSSPPSLLFHYDESGYSWKLEPIRDIWNLDSSSRTSFEEVGLSALLLPNKRHLWKIAYRYNTVFPSIPFALFHFLNLKIKGYMCMRFEYRFSQGCVLFHLKVQICFFLSSTFKVYYLCSISTPLYLLHTYLVVVCKQTSMTLCLTMLSFCVSNDVFCITWNSCSLGTL